MSDDRSLFDRVCRGQRGPRVPIWIMRQAGRYLPEYREIRERVDFLTATRTPEIAARITMLPMRRFRLDAAILFSDIMTPLEAMGVSIRFAPGPVVEEPIRTAKQVDSLPELIAEAHVPFVLESVRLVRNELDADRALIGFAGAPFTLFCYLVQGSGSKDFMAARRFLLSESEAANRLLEHLGKSMATYLTAQARAGADAVMVFDSWAGLLGPDDYTRFCLPVLRRLVEEFKAESECPLIYFVRGGATLLDAVAHIGADVVGLDWHLSLSKALDILGPRAVVQGNLDPAYLYADRDTLVSEIQQVLESGAAAAGHVFNLGHGIHESTNPDQVEFLVDHVHEVSERLGL